MTGAEESTRFIFWLDLAGVGKDEKIPKSLDFFKRERYEYTSTMKYHFDLREKAQMH